MVLTVVETAEFIASYSAVWTESEREAFIDWIASNPEAGDVMPGTRGLRKVRFSRRGMGKRGGARVIYFTRSACGQVVLLLVYAKAKFDTLPPVFLKRLRELYDV